MKRLLDVPHLSDPSDRRLAELFAAASTPDADPFRKRRIHARLLASRGSRQGRSWSSGLVWAVLGTSLALGTAAAATIAQQVRDRWSAPTPTAPVLSGSDPNVTVSRVRGQRIPFPVESSSPESELERTESELERTAPELEHPAPELEHTAPDHERAAPSASPRAVESSSRARQDAEASEDPTLVAAAIQALRRQRDPVKARALLNRYLRANPRGALAEEALALSIEAASVMKDSAASQLGCKYLALYPNGRHRPLASRACETPTDK